MKHAGCGRCADLDCIIGHLESYDSGIPLVSAVKIKSKTYLLWQYKRDDYVFDFESDGAHVVSANDVNVDLTIFCVPSLGAALEFITAVESKRQGKRYPEVRFGVMPGTRLN